MNKTDKQIFCADANMCSIVAKCNSQNKWELWRLSGVSETGEPKYEQRLFKYEGFDDGSDGEFDDIEPINTTSGHTHIKVLKDNNWSIIVFIEVKIPTEDEIFSWQWCWSEPPYIKHTIDDTLEPIESLVERGAGENPYVIIDQIETCSCSVFNGKYNGYLLLLIDYFLKDGIDVNAKNEWGDTALISAAYNCDIDIISLLLRYGAEINDKNNKGATALQYACRGLNTDVVELLLENGAVIDSECLFSIFGNMDLSAEEIQGLIYLSELLLSKGIIDVNARTCEGKTALMYIAEYQDDLVEDEIFFIETLIELIQINLDYGADINAQDNNGKTALMHAIKAKNKQVAEYLLDHGADANIKDNSGNTAIVDDL
jgi:ankyrin repeat protein